MVDPREEGVYKRNLYQVVVMPGIMHGRDKWLSKWVHAITPFHCTKQDYQWKSSERGIGLGFAP